MNKDIRKKAHEKFLLERFLECSGIEANIEKDWENPDFIIQVDGKRIGVELTNLYIPTHPTRIPMQAEESAENKLLAHARTLYEQSGGKPVQVTALFGASSLLSPLNKEARNRIAAALAAQVMKRSLHSMERLVYRLDDFDDDELENSTLLHWFSSVTVLGVPTQEMAHWGAARAGWASELSLSELQALVDKKAERLEDYRRVVPENWLLITSDGTKPSQMFRPELTFEPRDLKSPFERTFYFGHPRRMFFEF